MPTVKVNDINMYYEIRGDGDPLVLIAGLGNRPDDLRAYYCRDLEKIQDRRIRQPWSRAHR